MDWLEKLKKAHPEDESITSEVAGQAHMEQRALQLFAVSDKNDRQQVYGKNLVKVVTILQAIYVPYIIGIFHSCNINGMFGSFWRSERRF